MQRFAILIILSAVACDTSTLPISNDVFTVIDGGGFAGDADCDGCLEPMDTEQRSDGVSIIGQDIPVIDTDAASEQQRVWSLRTASISGGLALEKATSTSDGNPLVCGASGLVRFFTGSEWNNIDTGVDVAIAGCHGTTIQDIVAVGDQGRVWRRIGSAWSNEDLVEQSPGLRDVHVQGENDFIVVGVAGSIYRRNTLGWSDQSVATSAVIEAISGVSEQIYATGDQLLLAWNGSEWEQESIPEDPAGTPAANQGFRGRDIYVSDSGEAWAVGDSGKVVYRDAQGVWARQDAKWQATAFLHVFATEPGLTALGDKGLYRRFEDGAWTVPTIESPEFVTEQPPTIWPAERKVPPQATLSFVGGVGSSDGDIWLFTRTGQWITYEMDPLNR